MKTSKKNHMGFDVPDPVLMLRQMGQSMMDLSDTLQSEGAPLLSEDRDLIRMAYVPMIKALMDEELTAFIAGHNADNLHVIREIYTYLERM